MTKHQHQHKHHLHTAPDCHQLFFLGVCLFDLSFFLFYLFAYELDTQSMISDTLFTTPEYAIVLSITLGVRLVGAAMFIYRFRDVYPMWEYIGYIGICITAFGWGWLVRHTDNANHFTGVGLFCMGSFMYSMAFLELVGRTHEHLRQLHQGLRWFLLLSTLVLVIAFVILWVIEENNGQHLRQDGGRNAYIVEHVAYITHIMFYATFFLYHTPDPNKPSREPSEYEEEELLTRQDGINTPMVCMTLLNH